MHFSIGLRYMLLSALGFALMAVCVKLVHARGIPVLEIVAARALVSLVLSYIDVRRKKISLFGTHYYLLLARGAVGAAALVSVYSAVTILPLAEATVLQYLHPMFVAILALLFLGERFNVQLVFVIGLSFVGVLFVVEPPWVFGGAASSLNSFGVTMALLGAFGSAIAYVLVRKLSALEDSSVIIFYFPMIALPMSIILLGDDAVWPGDAYTWLLLLLVGVFTQVGQVGLTKSMQTEAAARATAFSYVQVLFALVFGVIVFNEWPSASALIGAALIISGALLNVFLKQKK